MHSKKAVDEYYIPSIYKIWKITSKLLPYAILLIFLTHCQKWVHVARTVTFASPLQDALNLLDYWKIKIPAWIFQIGNEWNYSSLPPLFDFRADPHHCDRALFPTREILQSFIHYSRHLTKSTFKARMPCFALNLRVMHVAQRKIYTRTLWNLPSY